MNAAAGQTQLYIYYRVPLAREEAVCAAVAAWQARLRSRFDGLETALLRRPEDDGGKVTLMEIYRRPGGIDAAVEKAIADAASDLGSLGCGPRRIERFVPLA